MTSTDDESLILALINDFWVAVERGIPREIAALMCADEAEPFLDNVFDPDSEEVVEPIGEPGFQVSGIRVFGDAALARIAHSPTHVVTLFFRREGGRWTVCADAEDDLPAEQLENDLVVDADGYGSPGTRGA